ncbi:MAG: glycine-rich domain-containing protein-like [Acaryochloridaceae cyanobacterium RL_2_7]|nr:glycine-rich domain-containing protein-like [Acaryochloridaceae cyanobacterium RL_2_7]
MKTTDSKQNLMEFAQRLDSIDFGPIAYKLIHTEEAQAWSYEKAKGAIAQYRQFLCLVYLYPNKQIIPSREVDDVWHTHILDTAKYREDCDLLFGDYLDHWPYLDRSNPEEQLALEDAFAETQRLWAQHFNVYQYGTPEKNEGKS